MKTDDPAAWRAKKFFDAYRAAVDPDVTREFITGLFRQAANCACCGKALALAYRPVSDREFRSDPDAPSIDRVNNEKGYTRTNVAVICWACNYRKSDLTLADLSMFERYIRAYGDV